MGTRAICGEEFADKDMIRICPSPAHPKWLCWRCYKLSLKENQLGDMRRANRFAKIKENRRVK